MTISEDQARRLAASLGEVGGRAAGPATRSSARPRPSRIVPAPPIPGDFKRMLLFASSLALVIGLSPGAMGVPSRGPGLPEENAMNRGAVLAAAVSLLGSQVAAAQVDAVEWRVEDGGNGHWYAGLVFAVPGASWLEARTAALSRGADLVSLNTTEERAWVFQYVSSDAGLWTTTLGPWVGGFQSEGSPEPGGGWQWVDGAPLYADFYWDGYHPDGNNNCGGVANFMCYWGNYVDGVGDLFADGPDVRRWTCWNIDFGAHPSAIVEWSADCDQNGLVDYGEIVRGEKTDANANGVPDCCESSAGCCPGDVDGDGAVNGIDLAIVLARWGGPAKDYPKADGDGNGIVDGADLALILGAWGDCG